MKTPGYMSYKKYKNDKKNNSQKAIVVFIAAFFVMLAVFIGMAKQLSPEVDVTIGEDSFTESKDSGLGVKNFIDDRLKSIQMEDQMISTSKDKSKPEEKEDTETDDDNEIFSKEFDEKVKLPKKHEAITLEHSKPLFDNPARPDVEAELKQNIAPVEPISKVVVGYYTTVEQAKVAQSILQDSGMGLTPFIKDLGGAYTLQVGSFSTRKKADVLVNDLLRNNFPARVLQE